MLNSLFILFFDFVSFTLTLVEFRMYLKYIFRTPAKNHSFFKNELILHANRPKWFTSLQIVVQEKKKMSTAFYGS